ncbi:MAG: MXAN_2562 family outer membrane beta-barrel protein [Archangium sp.]
MKRWFTLLVTVAASSALAQTFVSDERKLKESPRSMFFEFKLSPYTPVIDSAFTSLPEEQRPYAKFFGNTPMLLGEIEIEYQLFQKFGSIAVGLSGGYAEKYGKSIDAASGAAIAQSTGLHVVPLKVLAIYRFDWLKQKTKVPLVPYAKGAFVTMPWWITNGGTIEISNNVRGEGVRFGLAAVLGLAFELDFLDPRLARDFDSSMGVNHTYLFAEGTIQAMDLFPSAGPPLNLSSQHFMFGIGLEF